MMKWMRLLAVAVLAAFSLAGCAACCGAAPACACKSDCKCGHCSSGGKDACTCKK